MTLSTVRSLYGSSKPADAWVAYMAALRADTCTAEDHVYGAFAAREIGELQNGRRAAEAAIASRAEGDLLGKARWALGLICREWGDTHSAIEAFGQLHAEWHHYPHLQPLLLGAMWYNLGLAHDQRREWAQSVKCCELAEAEFRAEGMKDYLRQALQNRAWALCRLKDAAGATEALDEAQPLIQTQEAKWQQVIGRAYAALVFGEYRTVLELARSIPNEGVPVDVQSQVAWIAGRACLATGNVNKAVQLAEISLSWGARAHDVRCLQDGSELRRDCLLVEQGKTGA